MGKFKKFKKRGKKLNESDIKSVSKDELGSALLELEQSITDYKNYLLESGEYTAKQIAYMLEEKMSPLLTLYSNTM